MSQIEFDNDGYEYQPSEHSEQGQPTPNKQPRTTFQGFTQESLAYSASSQDTNRISQSVNSPNFTKGPLILINNESDQNKQVQQEKIEKQEKIDKLEPQYLNKLKNQYQVMPKVVQVIKQQSPTPKKQLESVNEVDYEQQLNQERLNSEQLRIYNHIIKMELEKKLYNQGVFIINSKNKRRNENAIDLYLEIQHNRVQMQTIQNEYKQKDSIIFHLENQIKQCNQINDLMKKHENELQAQNDELGESIQNALQNINQANLTIQQLEQEKDALIDYIEESKETNKTLTDQLNQLQLNFNELQKQNQAGQEKLQRLQVGQQKCQNLEQELILKQSEINEADKIRQQLTKAVQEKQKEVMQYQLQLTESNNKITEFEQINREISRQFNESMHQVSNLKKQNEDQQSRIHYLNENLEQLNYEYESSMSKTGRQINEVDKVIFEKEQLIKQQQSELENILTQNSKIQQEFTQLLQIHQQFGALQEKHMSYVKKTELLKSDLELKINEITQLYESNEILNQQFEELKSQNNNLYIERQQILEELEAASQQKFEIETKLNQMTSDNEELQILLKERQDLSGKYHALEIKLQADIEYYEKTIQDLHQRLEDSFATSPQIQQEEKRVAELQRVYALIDRLIFSKSNQVSNEKPSMKLDSLIQQLIVSMEYLEQQYRKGNESTKNYNQTDRFFSHHGSMVGDQISKALTNRPTDSDIKNQSTLECYNVKQIQPYQNTVVKRKYFL